MSFACLERLSVEKTPFRSEQRVDVFFLISKILGLVLQPVNFLAVIGIAGILLGSCGFPRLKRKLTVGTTIVFAVLCFSPIGAGLLRPLEDRFSSPPADMPVPTGILVLGGAMDEDISAARGKPTLTAAAARLTTGAALALRYPSARLVFTGGSADLSQKGLSEAQGVRELWISLGIPEERMIFETASRNTFDNAIMTYALAAPHPGETWLLVTSAAHMPRSIGIFRKIGWRVVPFPVDFRTYGDIRDLEFSATALASLTKLDIAVHEWIGLAAYRLTNRSDALFPGPDP